MQVTSNFWGMCVATGTVLSAALNSVWTGTVQTELQLSGNQLLYAISPASCALLAIIVPVFEPLGVPDKPAHSVLGYQWTPAAVLWVLLSSCLGLVVSQSQCILIGATSGTTYSVISHTKTLLVVLMGVQLFGDSMTIKKLVGLFLALSGLLAYSSASVKSVCKKPVEQQVPQGEECIALLDADIPGGNAMDPVGSKHHKGMVC